MTWQAVFFDFDGVILDSAEVKARAFAHMYREHGSEVEQGVAACQLSHCGLPRHDKFRRYHKEFLGQDLDEAEVEVLCQSFARQVMQQVLAAPAMPGAMETLEQVLQAGIPCFLLSGTPQAELSEMVHALDLAHYFLEVHGAPVSKTDMLRDILLRHGFEPSRCLFLGDGLVDYAAASAWNVRFLGIVAPGEQSQFPEQVPTSAKVAIPDFFSWDIWSKKSNSG